jgi:hypothetical protein
MQLAVLSEEGDEAQLRKFLGELLPEASLVDISRPRFTNNQDVAEPGESLKPGESLEPGESVKPIASLSEAPS